MRSNERVQTQPNEVLHVNNTLNFNFNCFSPINASIIKKPMREA